jgi:hypothetical protein
MSKEIVKWSKYNRKTFAVYINKYPHYTDSNNKANSVVLCSTPIFEYPFAKAGCKYSITTTYYYTDGYSGATNFSSCSKVKTVLHCISLRLKGYHKEQTRVEEDNLKIDSKALRKIAKRNDRKIRMQLKIQNEAKAKGFKCTNCEGIAKWSECCQSYVCDTCHKHFWQKNSERVACKHCGYEKSFKCDQCGGTFYWEQSCGAYICDQCHRHKIGEKGQELARCFCGYGLHNGERLEDDIEA